MHLQLGNSIVTLIFVALAAGLIAGISPCIVPVLPIIFVAGAANRDVAESGKEISTRPFQLVTGRIWKGTAFGGARGRTDVPKIVDWYMDGKIEIDPMITHTLPLDDINRGFALMHSGESIRSVVVY